ncbi:Carotenoid 9,10(9',10')-cleavage dioxygenase 1 [Paramyrothecium foliicola]|nr:Carotenoid 9,10(9',10')-cleavage dioxygenase 1 [Paramyrothecium foliicola]
MDYGEILTSLRRYLSGNFAPVHSALPLTPCDYEGSIPSDLAGGEYVRNGGNPLTNTDLGRDAHWFDGDGMLSGVLFRRTGEKGTGIRPEFVNQQLLTDVYCYAKRNPSLRRPVLPSIATLVSPATSWLTLLLVVWRTIALVIVSRFPGRKSIKKISVANTSVIYHDGRALATCESGPPLRFALPGLETIGWYNGRKAENEPIDDKRSGLGGDGMLSFMREWTTAHPRVDPDTGELIAFHSTFSKPFVRYSIIKPSKQVEPGASAFDLAVPGIDAPKMMHDFGVSRHHTIILDLPLLLDPTNQMRGMPSLCYDSTRSARFGVFPRHQPEAVQWFETNPCLIFHTANSWDSVTAGTKTTPPQTTVNMLACRLTSASMVFRAGNLPTPAFKPIPPEYAEEEQCRLYYYQFAMASRPDQPARILQQWALSAIPFEFPTLAPGYSMKEARFVYGCSTSESFTVALGKASKIDYLVKFDVLSLIDRGMADPPQSIKGCVDSRTIQQAAKDSDPRNAIKVFRMPPGWFAQEPRFVPRANPATEDDGWLLSYVFDESQLDGRGDCRVDARSELWIIDAKEMRNVVAKIKLPQRVPYGLHGDWFTEEAIQQQKPFDRIRDLKAVEEQPSMWTGLRDTLEEWLR